MNREEYRKRLDAEDQRVDDPGELQKTLEISALRVPNEARYQTALRPDMLVITVLWRGFSTSFLGVR